MKEGMKKRMKERMKERVKENKERKMLLGRVNKKWQGRLCFPHERENLGNFRSLGEGGRRGPRESVLPSGQ